MRSLARRTCRAQRTSRAQDIRQAFHTGPTVSIKPISVGAVCASKGARVLIVNVLRSGSNDVRVWLDDRVPVTLVTYRAVAVCCREQVAAFGRVVFPVAACHAVLPRDAQQAELDLVGVSGPTTVRTSRAPQKLFGAEAFHRVRRPSGALHVARIPW